MRTVGTKVVWTIGLVGLSAAALAADTLPEAVKRPSAQEPAGFVTGAVIGGFAAGPIGAVIGAGLGTWLGNRVHRASDASKAEATLTALQANNAVLLTQQSTLTAANRTLSAQLDEFSQKVQIAQTSHEDYSAVLDGMQGDVLFRTGSAEISPDTLHQVQVLAQAVAKSPALKIRIDGYADSRGTVEDNLKLSEARANAVRDLLLAAGIREEALEVNAYGDTQSIAEDADGYALERRVRMTLQADDGAAVAQVNDDDL